MNQKLKKKKHKPRKLKRGVKTETCSKVENRISLINSGTSVMDQEDTKMDPLSTELTCPPKRPRPIVITTITPTSIKKKMRKTTRKKRLNQPLNKPLQTKRLEMTMKCAKPRWKRKPSG